ncbi:putative transcription factor interactor and regulator CCHC(Zn) family [Helianthus annuus]|nr:putative transcription factor interactor and regulator CCHC(Zn) family [Helianthus annuus]
MIQESCEKLKAENDKLLGGLDSLTFENRKLKENIKVFENKQKSSEDEDFWIKLENKNLKASESKFQEQIKILENEKTVLEILKNENEKTIKSHLEKISRLESEAENSRVKIEELEKKLIGFVTSSDKLNIPCPKPINSVPISDNVTNFDFVKVEDCDETPDDENIKKEKQKLFSNLKEKFQKTVLQSTEKGECSEQKPLKKKVEQKQKENKSSSGRSSNQKQKLKKVKNENSKIVGNKWCRSDHSAKASNPASLRKEYHQAKQCFDLSVWTKNGDRYDNRMCYSCGYYGHIAVNCRYWRYETRRCFNCNIKGHIARECPRRSNERLRAKSQKSAKFPVKVKPQEQKVVKPKVQEQSTQEKKVKLSQGQKDRLRKKRKKAREYLEKILSSGSQDKQNKSSDESNPSVAKTSKTNSSDTNLRTEQREKKKEKVGDESDRSKSDKPPAGNDSGMVKPEEPLVEVKVENSSLAMDDANFPPLLSKNSKSPKGSQAWVKLFK